MPEPNKTRLSVNINKFATLRNARGKNNPDLVKVAQDCERYGAQGITVHPRPDERHIRYADVEMLKEVVKTEFNIEGNPKKGRYLELVLQVKPHQATLVPDEDGAITSNAGWDTVRHGDYLKEIADELRKKGIRSSVFVDPVPEMVQGAARAGVDRIELYTEHYAENYRKDKRGAVEPYIRAARLAHELGLGVNGGHDLSLENLHYFYLVVPHLAEVSIGHALICDAFHFGLENTVQLYLRQLRPDL